MKKIILLSCILILMPLSVLAATINVPGDQATIQVGIDASINGDTVLIADGTYTGVGNYNIDFSGKSITVKSVNGPDNCIIDCQRNGRAFLAYSDETVTLDGLTIKNGDAGDGNDGGAVYVYGSDIIVADCVFENNSASSGSAVFTFFSHSSSFTNCTFTSNSASSGGTVVTFYSSPFTNCTFTSNCASSGGAVYHSPASSSSFSNCTFTSNNASSGGAVYSSSSHSSSSFTNCTFTSNSASSGGAVYYYDEFYCSSYSFSNCTFTLNEAANQGGAIWCEIPLDPEDPITIKNCILWGNTAPEGQEIYEAEKPPIVTYSDIQGGHTGEGNINADPLFLSIDTAGDLYLHPYSPCIDSGTEGGAPADDIDGYIRPIGPGYDMGAYEYRYDAFVWEGQTSKWNDAGNWKYNETPTHTDFTIISSLHAVSEPEVYIDEVAVGTLLIESGTLTIDQGTLSIGGS